MAETQPAPQQEILLSRERMLSPSPMVGLHTRMLLGGDAINPVKRDLPSVTKEQLGTFEQRDYSVFERASKSERSSHWQGKEGNDLEQQKRAWIESTVRTFQNAKEFFIHDPKGQQWSEVFARLGVDTDNFTAVHASALYRRYFEQHKDTAVKQFVSDVVAVYQTGAGIDLQRLMQDLPAVEWLAHIFGNTSSEVIRELVDAEIQLQTQPDRLIAQANEKQVVSGQEMLRINNLNDNEVRLLRFLAEGAQTGVQTADELLPVYTPRTRPKDITITGERLREMDEHPGIENAKLLIDPNNIAANLRARFPEKYGRVARETLVQEIAKEQEALEQARTNLGLTNERLLEVVNSAFDEYEQFIEQTYGVNLPDVKSLQILPLQGKMSEAYRPDEQSFAFIAPDLPVIFLNFDLLTQEAKKDLQHMGQQEVLQTLEKLLKEVSPHEKTHLMADITYWQVHQKGEPDERRTGKLGMNVGKVFADARFGLAYKHRGEQLMEGVTAALIEQWLRRKNLAPHTDVYPQERQVVYALTQMIAQEQHTSPDEAFKIFVDAYFNKLGLRHLNEALSGVSHEGGKTTRTRPYFTQELYAIMEYEEQRAAVQGQQSNYALTHSFIQNKGDVTKLSDPEKRAIREILQTAILQDPRIPFYLSPAAMKDLAKQLGLRFISA